MKISFLSFCLVASSLFIFTQCKKDNSSSSTNTTVNYSPLTVGSNWTYNYTDGTSSPGTFTLTVTGKDTTANGIKYNLLSSSDGSQNTYLAKVDSNYYRITAFAGIGSLQELYLKDNRPEGSTWTGSAPFTLPGVPIPLTADLTYLVKEKGITRPVNGKTYNDVIHINVAIGVLTQNFGGGDFYYAKDIGMIESNISLNPPGQAPYSSTQQLVSYEIK